MSHTINVDQSAIVIDVVDEKPVLNIIQQPITLEVESGGVVPAAIDTSIEAGTNLSALRGITTDGNGKAIYASNTTFDGSIVIGISKTAPSQGENVLIQTSGLITDAGWSWTKGLVFLGTNGTLTQSFPSAGSYLAIVGKALTPTTIQIQFDTPTLMG